MEENDKIKSQEETFGQFREEILQLKNEKKDLKLKLRSREGELSILKKKVIQKNEEKILFEDEIKDKVMVLKAKDVEYKNLEKKKVKLENEFDKTMQELEAMKKKNGLENNNSGQVQLNCPICNEKYESKVDLNQHVRNNHRKDQVSQTPPFKTDIKEKEDKTEIIDVEYS